MGDENPLVLVVEDASDVRQLVRTVLERAGFGVAEAADGNAALRQFHQVRPDVVVLDVGLPGLDGWQVLERIRIMSETPLLMLTALGTEFDKIRGLDGGADDYLVKPFSNGELVARVRALSRRPRESHDQSASFDDGPLHIDYAGYRVEQDGEPVKLTRTEFNLLAVLTMHKGQVLSPEQLIERAWRDPTGIGEGKVKFAIRRLRETMGWDKDLGPLETVRQFGYRYRGMDAMVPPR
ncbi:MAG TPA: response regulator transcription factor [Acidimicrobiales bacterium]|jgi:DNA-binding response OmpR family regulator